jgi:CHASE3 domain sensor protein
LIASMNTRLIRLLLVVIGVAMVSVAAYYLRDLESRITNQRASAESLREQATTLNATIADARAGQFGYVARGQGEAFWMSHVAGLLPMLQRQSAAFAESLTAPAAHAAFESAANSVENFRTLDSRVKEFVIAGNALLAADLIFSEGLESTSTASRQIVAALNEELQVRSADVAQMRVRQLSILGIAAAGLVGMMLVLAFTAPEAQKAASQEAASPIIAPIKFEAPLPKAKPAIMPKLVRTAQLCSELAGVSDEGQLTGLIERAARLLDASGIIVWVVDPSGDALQPAMSHGYADQIVRKMGKIHRDANNAAAAAYRSGAMRTVCGEAGANGAVVAPLITSAGCIGVLSAEMKAGAEKDESSQALAAIFAAQLATLVAPAEPAHARIAAQG